MESFATASRSGPVEVHADGEDSSELTPFERPSAVLAATLAACCALVQCTATPRPHKATAPVVPSSSTAVASPASPPPETAAGTVEPVTAAQLGASWRPGCPVEPAQLRRVGVDYVGMDGRTHRGELVVHEDLATEVLAVFEELHRLGYPIEKIRTVDQYPAADDELSMEDNNTSAFNCRSILGTNSWSQHAYGRAIDLNPLLNPCLYAGGAFQPQNAAAYLDRSRTDPGLFHDGDPALRAFTDRGWQWGGYWPSPIDYQHFERP